MKYIIGIAFLLCAGLAFGTTDYADRCTSDLAVHAVVDGQPASESLVTHDQVSRITTATDGGSGKSMLNIQLDDTGAERMYQHTGDNQGESIVVLCDGEKIWRAAINAPFGERFSVLLPE